VDADEAAEAERYRVEAIAAFSHEIRTPLTSLKMLIELGRRHGKDGEAHFDGELTELLVLTVDELTRLVDDMQRASRLMRGMLPIVAGPQTLRDIIDQAHAAMPGGVLFEEPPFEEVTGMWDAEQLAEALAGFAVATDRLGDGKGRVKTAITTAGDAAEITFSSGGPARSGEAFRADAGYGFFRARQFIVAMGGRVECQRAKGFALVNIKLPYGLESPRGSKNAHPAR